MLGKTARRWLNFTAVHRSRDHAPPTGVPLSVAGTEKKKIAMIPRDVVRSNAIAAVGRYLTTEDFDKRFGQHLIKVVQFDPQSINVAPQPLELQAPETLVFPFVVTQASCNNVGSCHGGVLSSLADVFTTVHLWGLAPERKHVSVNLEINFMNPALVGRTVECHTSVLRNGRKLAFTNFSFVDVETGELLANGTHNKAYI